MTQACEEILTFLSCDYELFDSKTNDRQIWQHYRDEAELGRAGGYLPLLVVPSDTLAETLEFFCEPDGLENTPFGIARLREELIARAQTLDGESILRARLEEYSQMHEGDDLLGSFLPAVRVQDTPCIPRDESGEVILARLSANQPWELAVWVPMGGFNDCPPPAQQAAVFRYWHQRYGAVPALVTYDVWELTVERPALGDADCEELAKEHFAFSYDNVMQSEAGSIRGLASGLRGATIWTFWWD